MKMSLCGGLVIKSCPTLVTPWTVTCQAPLSMGFSRQEYWSGFPFPSPGDLPNPGIEPKSPAFQADSLLTDLWWKPICHYMFVQSKRICNSNSETSSELWTFEWLWYISVGSSLVTNVPLWWIILKMGEWHWNMYNIMYEMSRQSRSDARYWVLGAGALGRPRGRVWGGRREEGSGWGTQVYLWRIHFDIWQN